MSAPMHKYPRTPHLAGSRLQPGDHDLEQVPLASLRGAYVVVEEKLDGANAGISLGADGEDPAQYVEVSFKVSERAYTAWPDRIRQAFEPARTVRTGRAIYRLALMSDVARRDSPHADGVISMQGGR